MKAVVGLLAFAFSLSLAAQPLKVEKPEIKVETAGAITSWISGRVP